MTRRRCGPWPLVLTLWTQVATGCGGIEPIVGISYDDRQERTQLDVYLPDASARRTASSDYDAVRLGAAVEYRHYWRGPARSGWLAGARLDVTTSQLSMSSRPVGTLFGTGLRAEVGYRLTPWRSLALTALAGAGFNLERDLDGRLPTQSHRVLGFGLDVGWLF